MDLSEDITCPDAWIKACVIRDELKEETDLENYTVEIEER